MFNNPDTTPSSDTETIIGSTVKVEGDFIGQGNIIVEGEVIGSLKTDGDLRIGSRATIRADVTAASAVVAGTVHGNITTQEQLELLDTAVVDGDIMAARVSMVPGAVFNGKCSMEQKSSKNVAASALKAANEEIKEKEEDK